MPRLADQRKRALTSMMRDGIYDAAIAVLERSGPDGLTMDRVAEEAGVAKGSLYNYFPNKSELLNFVHERTIEPLIQQTREVMARDLGAAEKLKGILHGWTTYIEGRRGLFNFLFNEYAIHKVIKLQDNVKHKEILQEVACVIRQGIEEGEFRPMDADHAAMLLMGGAKETYEQLNASQAPWNIDEIVDTMVSFFLCGLRCVEASQSPKCNS